MSGSGERRTSCHFDLIGESWRIGLKLAEWNRLVDETDFDRLPGGDRQAGHASGIKFQAVDDGTGYRSARCEVLWPLPDQPADPRAGTVAAPHPGTGRSDLSVF